MEGIRGCLSRLQRWFGRRAVAANGETAPLPKSVAAAQPALAEATESAAEAGLAGAASVAAFRVVEVVDAEFLAGALFRRRFATTDFPQTPKHFVAFHQGSDGNLRVLGYVHYEIWQQQAMGGGLVIDERAYRQLPAADRAALRAGGGVAELMLRESFALLPASLIAIWAYIGDALSEKVNRRVGFQPTGEQYIRVIWRRPLSASEQATWLQRVIGYGPF